MPNQTLSQCKTRLKFVPRQPWPIALPIVAWQNVVIAANPEALDDPSAVVWSPAPAISLADTVWTCYPQLGLSELAHLTAAIGRVDHPAFHGQEESILQKYELRWCDRLDQTFSVVLQTPPAFQRWIDERKLGVRELAPLLAVGEVGSVVKALDTIAALNCAKNTGVSILENLVELFLMKSPLSDLLPEAIERPESWRHRLDQLRHPRTAAQDAQHGDDVAQWPWPVQTRGQWKRTGDRSGVEITLFAASADDLTAKLEKLKSIGAAWRHSNANSEDGR